MVSLFLPETATRLSYTFLYSNTETYYLVIADENGLQMQREEFQIDIAFAVDEFDFFG